MKNTKTKLFEFAAKNKIPVDRPFSELSDEQKNIIDVCGSVQSYKCLDIKQYILIKDKDKTYPAVIKLKVIKNAKTI